MLIIFVDVVVNMVCDHLHGFEVLSVEPQCMDTFEKLDLVLQQTAVLTLNEFAACILNIYLADEFAFFGGKQLVISKLFSRERKFLFLLLRQVEVLGPLELATVLALVD